MTYFEVDKDEKKKIHLFSLYFDEKSKEYIMQNDSY